MTDNTDTIYYLSIDQNLDCVAIIIHGVFFRCNELEAYV